MALASVNIRFGVDMKEFSSKMQRATKKVKKFGKDMQKAGKTMTAAFSAPLALMGGRALQVFDEQIQAEMRLASALRATGQDAEKQMPKLKAFASEIQGMSTVGDEATLSMMAQATSMGLNAQQAQTAAKQAIGLAAAFGMNEKSAIRYTAALADGETTMLNRYIPTLRSIEDQSERAAKAHEMLNGMFGQAQVAAQDGLGPLKQLNNSLGDLLEQFGAIIADAIRPFVNRLKDLVHRFQDLDRGTKETITKILGLTAAVGPLMTALGFMVTSILPQMARGFSLLFSPAGAIAIGIAVLAGVVKGFIDLNTELDLAKKKTEAMNDVRRRANRTIGTEVSKVNNLVSIAENERVSKERRLKAVQKLKGISDDFNGVLEGEKINLEKLKTASDDYTASLLKQAKVKAAKNKLAELESQLLDLKVGAEQVGTSFSEKAAIFVQNAAGVFGAGGAAQFALDVTSEGAQNQEDAIKAVNAQIEKLQGYLKDNDGLFDEEEQNAVQSMASNMQKVADSARQVAKVSAPDTRGLASMGGMQMPDMQVKDPVDTEAVQANPDPYRPWRESLQKFRPIVGSIQQGFQGFFNTLLQGGQNPFQAIIDSIKQLITRLLAAAAAAAVLAAIMSAIGVGAAAGGGGFGAGFKQIFGGMTGLNLGKSAAGGANMNAAPRLVGEMGPEVFVPQGPGRIIPNNTPRRGRRAKAARHRGRYAPAGGYAADGHKSFTKQNQPMALATLLHYSYKDYQGNDYTISLIDTQANAAGSGTEVAGRAATLQYEGDSDLHPYVPILYGKMDAYFEVPTQAVEDIIVNALTGDENRYLLHMERNGDAFFIGVVQAEQVELPRAGRPYAFKISATDGLKRLENERGAVPGDMTRPIVNNMLYFLNQSPVAALYSAGDPFMQVSSQYWEEDMDDAYTVTVDPLRRYAIQSTNDLYLEENNDGDDRYRSHLHRLKDICHAFGLQLYFQEGLYKFIQLDQKRTGTLRLHTYTVDFKAVKGDPTNTFTGTASYQAAATVLNVDNENNERAGGTASFMPQVRQVNTTEKDRLRLYPRSFFSDLDSSPVSLLTIPASTSADGLQLRLDVGADAQNFS
ncbi:MAG: hypothetical protein RI842_09180, partial [Schleiferiaceae bacterium]|nr:hypothetical protein [Schleiferiaceae bacterium]